MSGTCTDCEAYLLQSNSFQILNNSLYAWTIVRHASQPKPRGMPLTIGTERHASRLGACLLAGTKNYSIRYAKLQILFAGCPSCRRCYACLLAGPVNYLIWYVWSSGMPQTEACLYICSWGMPLFLLVRHASIFTHEACLYFYSWGMPLSAACLYFYSWGMPLGRNAKLLNREFAPAPN